MTPKERLLAVLRGETPDVVPWFADLSHWFYARRSQRFAPSPEKQIDYDMVDLYKEVGAGIYIELGGILGISYEGDVRETQTIEGDRFLWTVETPVGKLQEVRLYNETSSSWDIARRMVQSPADLGIVRYVMERRRFVPLFDKYRKMVEACGEHGLPYACGVPYSGLGFFMSRFMGVENTVYALCDAPAAMAATIALINEVNLQAIELLCASPAEVVFVSDNLSSDVQTPALFDRFSSSYYGKAADMVHAAGKHFAAHLDGRVRGLLSRLVACGVDVADAVTPGPTGDMTPAEIRAEAGPEIVLSGGVSPVKWSPATSDEDFIAHVRKWLDLRHISPRLIMSDGDQVPPETDRRRIGMMREVVEEYGQYR